MTMTAPRRLNNAELAQIGRRLQTPLNDDGLRAWYRNDVTGLLEEVMALRRDRAAAMATLAANPPLEGLDQDVSLAEVAAQLAQLWTDHQQGVWQRAEVKRIREKLAETAQKLEATERAADEMSQHINQQNERIEQLQAQLVDAIADGHRAVAEVERGCVERAERVTALLTEAAGVLRP